jgi:hypothetical protein
LSWDAQTYNNALLAFNLDQPHLHVELLDHHLAPLAHAPGTANRLHHG